MNRHSIPPSLHRRRGFTLTELAIVMGIIGAVLGGIWVASSAVSDSSHLQTAQQEASYILSGYRSLFGQRGVNLPTTTDLTCGTTVNGVTDGFFPAPMGGSGCSPSSYPASYPRNPWGGYVAVRADSLTGTQGIGIEYGGLPQAACVRYAFAAPNTPDILAVLINGTAQALPVTMAGITGTDGCATGSGNSVQIEYRLP